MDYRTKRVIDDLVGQIARLEERVATAERAQATPQLPNSSLTNAAIRMVDADGTDRGSIGYQSDGTVAIVPVNGPPPPKPSAPGVAAGQLSLAIAWDGLFAEGDDGDPATQPLDFDHVQVHLSTAAVFTPDASTLYGSLAKPGSLVCTPLVDGTTYYAVLVGVNTSSIAGEPSAASSGVPDAVVASEILDGIVTTVKLADDAVTAAKIAAAAVGTTEISDNAVTTPKVVAGAIQTGQIAAGAVQAGQIAAGAVTTAKLDALAVTSANIAANAITSGKIAAGAITAATIAAGAIDGKTITGATVITQSATGGLFVYSGTPATGNLLVSIAAQAGTDPYGNAYPQGISSSAGDIGGTLNVSSAGISFYVPNAGTGNLRTSIANADGTDRYGNTYKAGLFVNQKQIWATGDHSHTVIINPTGQSGPEALFLPSGALSFVHLLGDLANNRFLIENTGSSTAFLELNMPVKATAGYLGSTTFQGAEVTYPVSSSAFTDYTSAKWTPPTIVCPPSETIDLDIWFDGHPSTATVNQTITLAARIKQGSTVLYAPVDTASGVYYSNDGANTTTNDVRCVGHYTVGRDILSGRAGQTITFVPTVRITSTSSPNPHILRAGMSVKPSLYSQANSTFI